MLQEEIKAALPIIDLAPYFNNQDTKQTAKQIKNIKVNHIVQDNKKREMRETYRKLKCIKGLWQCQYMPIDMV